MPTVEVYRSRFIVPSTAQKSIQLNGSSDYFQVPFTPSTDGFSFGFWLDPLASVQNAVILGYLNTTNDGGFKLYRESNNRIGLILKNGTTSDVAITSKAQYVRPVRWSWIWGSYVQNSTKLYIGSTLVSEDTACTMTAPDVAQTLTIGKNSNFASGYANIGMYGLTLHNTGDTPWTEDEVVDLMRKHKLPAARGANAAVRWSLNNTHLDDDGGNALTLGGTSYVSKAPFQPRSAI